MSETSLTLGDVSAAGLSMSDSPDQRVRALVDAYYEFVWRALRRLGVLDGDVDDATQSVFLVAAGKVDSIRKDSERSFLFQTALRVAADHRKRHLRRREVPEADVGEPTDDGPRPDDLLDMKMARRTLDGILESMPLEVRAVFTLFEFDQMTLTEIAALLSVPRGTVASRLRRAKAIFHERAARASRLASGGARR
jgi:RNA polymerase sigma-70 factor (ECF subfamily)